MRVIRDHNCGFTHMQGPQDLELKEGNSMAAKKAKKKKR
jgi:hypothetical protein